MCGGFNLLSTPHVASPGHDSRIRLFLRQENETAVKQWDIFLPEILEDAQVCFCVVTFCRNSSSVSLSNGWTPLTGPAGRCEKEIRIHAFQVAGQTKQRLKAKEGRQELDQQPEYAIWRQGMNQYQLPKNNWMQTPNPTKKLRKIQVVHWEDTYGWCKKL